MVLGLKPMGKLVTSKKNISARQNQGLAWSSNLNLWYVLDRTKVLHGPRTQTYGKTSYFKKNLSARQNQGLAWSSDSNLWGN